MVGKLELVRDSNLIDIVNVTTDGKDNVSTFQINSTRDSFLFFYSFILLFFSVILTEQSFYFSRHA